MLRLSHLEQLDIEAGMTRPPVGTNEQAVGCLHHNLATTKLTVPELSPSIELKRI